MNGHIMDLGIKLIAEHYRMSMIMFLYVPVLTIVFGWTIILFGLAGAEFGRQRTLALSIYIASMIGIIVSIFLVPIIVK